MDKKSQSNSPAPQDIQFQYSQAPGHKQKIIDAYHSCPFCGGEHTITHQTRFIDHQVIEKFHCESCEQGNYEVGHLLH